MKHILITTIAALVLVGCGESQPPESPTVKAPDISIHEAVGTGNIEAVKKHLAAGTDVNANDGGWTPLWYAADEGHKEIVELLIAKGADVNAKNDKFVGTFLHWAAAGGQNEIVKLLIAKGADVNATDGDGDTALHLAGSTTASTEIAELLISKGADVNAMNLSPPGRRIGGMTPLDMATLGNRTEIATLLRKHGGKTKKELEAAGN